jgi:hypothetical protein
VRARATMAAPHKGTMDAPKPRPVTSAKVITLPNLQYAAIDIIVREPDHGVRCSLFAWSERDKV